MDSIISNIIQDLNSLKSHIEANEDRWSYIRGGVSSTYVKNEIDKAVEELNRLLATKANFTETTRYLVDLESRIEKIRQELGAIEFSLKCGNGVCEEGENQESQKGSNAG